MFTSFRDYSQRDWQPRLHESQLLKGWEVWFRHRHRKRHVIDEPRFVFRVTGFSSVWDVGCMFRCEVCVGKWGEHIVSDFVTYNNVAMACAPDFFNYRFPLGNRTKISNRCQFVSRSSPRRTTWTWKFGKWRILNSYEVCKYFCLNAFQRFQTQTYTKYMNSLNKRGFEDIKEVFFWRVNQNLCSTAQLVLVLAFGLGSFLLCAYIDYHGVWEVLRKSLRGI